MSNTPITWTETTEEAFWYALEVLPPAIMFGGGFLLGAPADHDAETGQPRYDGFVERPKGKYWASSRQMTIAEFKAIARTVNAQLKPEVA